MNADRDEKQDGVKNSLEKEGEGRADEKTNIRNRLCRSRLLESLTSLGRIVEVTVERRSRDDHDKKGH